MPVTLERGAEGFSIPAIHLTLKPRIPGADKATFRELAAKAKANCPVSRLFKAEITLDAQLVWFSAREAEVPMAASSPPERAHRPT